MALPATAIGEIEQGGSDTLNGGIFDPAFTGGTPPTDLTVTNGTGTAPVVSSASYNFNNTTDANAWLFIKLGTGWIPGWYKISSCAGNQATLNATAGSAFLVKNNAPIGPSTVNGCATTATAGGNSATWAIDYSQQNAAAFALTLLTTAAANAIILTSSASVAMVGNGVIIKAGTNFLTGTYMILAASAGVSLTVDRNCTSAAGAAGTCGIGGAFATPGMYGSIKVAGMDSFIQYNATNFTLTNGTANTAAGPFTDSTGGTGATNASNHTGYNTNRYITNNDANQPTCDAGSQASINVINLTGNYINLRNLIVDDKNQSGGSAVRLSGQHGSLINVTAKNAGTGGATGFNLTGSRVYCSRIIATGCAGVGCTAAIGGGTVEDSVFYANSSHGIQATAGVSLVRCISRNNTGASTDGFNGSTDSYQAHSCIAYGNGRSGFDCTGLGIRLSNCVAEANTGEGYHATAVADDVTLYRCASYNNSADYNAAFITRVEGFISQTAGSFFVNPVSPTSNFSPNNTTGQGALLRNVAMTMPDGKTITYLDVGLQHPDQHLYGSILIGGQF